MFPFGQQELHNITETAPETWGDVGFYDERSDIFSFAVILWRLFGSSTLYTENYNASESEDYAFVMENGRMFPPPRIREVIRKVCLSFISSPCPMINSELVNHINQGGRLAIHPKCPSIIALLIQECWHILPDSRPPSSTILARLISFYTSECMCYSLHCCCETNGHHQILRMDI